jgi:hypothetical protein
MRTVACECLEMGPQILSYHNESNPQTPRTTDGVDHYCPDSTINRKYRLYAGGGEKEISLQFDSTVDPPCLADLLCVAFMCVAFIVIMAKCDLKHRR